MSLIDSLDFPTERVHRPNQFTEPLTRMIAAFHANDNATPAKGAAGYPVPVNDGASDGEVIAATRRAKNLIRETARRIDSSVSIKARLITHDGKPTIVFAIVPARTRKPAAKPAAKPSK